MDSITKALFFLCFSTSLIISATSQEFEVELVPVALPPVPGVHHHTAHSPLLAPAHAPSHPHPQHHPHHHHAPVPAPAPSPIHHHHAPVPAPAPSPIHHHHHPHHDHAPVHTPVHAPIHAPSHAPAVHSPSHPPAIPHGPIPRSFIAVQGVVYCKSCKYAGVDTLIGAAPVLGAGIKLECNNSKRPVMATTKTDKNGYFFLVAPKTITTYAFHKCKASLVSSPMPSCSKPSALHGGFGGAILRPVKPFMANKLPFVLYNVGPFAFEPQCPHH